MEDHDYAGERVDSEKVAPTDDNVEFDEMIPLEKSVNLDHTPIKAPNPKKKKREKPSDETAMESILKAVTEMKAALDRQSEKLDTQTEFLRKFETRVEANTVAIKENNDNIVLLQQKVNELQKENKCLKEEVADVARYKRRWNLRLNGLPEKMEKTSGSVLSGGNPATSNNTPRSTIMQFVSRVVRDEVWKRSKDANVCKEMHIHFKEDFSREDRAARAKLWPLVQDARRRGQRAFLKEGYALINNQRVDPE
ncbi:hypothetical protein WMY93_007702 [Mugilogobius chulae]|uniref:Uncharacterized protein n=1 Tax=Mugilogobius chulae TaxID=88201 RepID=A0AAW0PIV4_9GOBI